MRLLNFKFLLERRLGGNGSIKSTLAETFFLTLRRMNERMNSFVTSHQHMIYYFVSDK